MIRRLQRGAGEQLSLHINQREVDCKCAHPECTFTLLDTDLIDALETLRLVVGYLSFDDVYRCPRHNAETPGSAPSGQHPLGTAADIKTALSPADTADAAEKVPAFANGGIGRYSHFTHVDVRGRHARWKG